MSSSFIEESLMNLTSGPGHLPRHFRGGTKIPSLMLFIDYVLCARFSSRSGDNEQWTKPSPCLLSFPQMWHCPQSAYQTTEWPT